MSLLDIALLAIIGVSALLGAWRGFIAAVASVLAWILAGWCAFHYGAEVAWGLTTETPPGYGALVGGYALAFVAVMLFVTLVGWGVGRLVAGIGLSGLNRLLGLVLGAARGVFIVCAVLLLLGLTGVAREPGWHDSPVVSVLGPLAARMNAWLPDWVAEQSVFAQERSGQERFGKPPAPGDNGRVEDLPLPAPLDEGVQ